MIPNVFKIELIRIAKIQTGAMYLIITTKIFSLLNLEDIFTSSMIAFGLIIYPTNIHVKNAPTGIKIVFVIKSIKSRI